MQTAVRAYNNHNIVLWLNYCGDEGMMFDSVTYRLAAGVRITTTN